MKPARSFFRQDTSGTAAIEFAGAAMFLVVCLANAIDLSVYEYRTMQVEDAAQIGAQTALQTCNAPSLLPATRNCATSNGAAANLNDAVTTAI